MYSSRDIQSIRVLFQVTETCPPAGAATPGADWSEADLKAMLRHCLAGPISSFLASENEEDQPQATLNPLLDHPAIACIDDLLEHPAPPVDLLITLKNQAKRLLLTRPPPVPPAISSVIYYSVILCARLKLDRRISELPDPRLLEGVEELLRIPWLPQTVARLMRQFHVQFADRPPDSPSNPGPPGRPGT